MRRDFLIWLSALICAVFVVTGMLAYYQFRKHAQDRATQVLSTRLTDLMELMTHSSASLEHVVSINNNSMLDRTRAMAELLRLNPSALKNQETLQGFCNDLGASQVSVTDSDGIVVSAVPVDQIGFDFKTDESARQFMKCITTPGSEICTRPVLATVGQGDLQYAGVSRRDKQGVVRVGFRTQHEQIMRAAASFGQLASNYQLGKDGHIVAFLGGEPLNKKELPTPAVDLLDIPLGKTGETSINDVDYYTYAIESKGFRLVGLMPVTELRDQTLQAVNRLVLSNLILFVLMFVLVAYLLQRLVIRGIRVINESLTRIAEGDLGQRVEVHSCPEFSELSTGINSMADTLLGYAEQEHQRIREDLELARSIQATALPSKFPAYPHHPEFDLYATCTPAKVVGGDFYDFYKLDSDHLAFLVADLSGSGISAALFMMRCMSVIRSVSRGSTDPQTIVTEANNALCQNNGVNMRVALFFGSLNIRTGELCYVNAGPPQTLIQHDGVAYEVLPSKSGAALGLSPNSAYERRIIMLEPGDRLFLYTEGAVKAMDTDNTPYGEARLQEALSAPAAGAMDVLRNVRASLRRFIGSSEPNMDITMLSLVYLGALHAHAEITTPAGKQDEVASTLGSPLESVLAAPDCISDLQATVNTILNALPAEEMVDIRLRCNAQEAQVTLRYAKPSFNPLLSLPHLPVDETRYQTDEAGSTLTLRKNLE